MKKNKTKKLYFDIETMANLGWVWGKYEQNVIKYKQEWFILCFGYKWAGEKKLKIVSVHDDPEYEIGTTNDEYVIKKLWELLNEADIVVAHNGDQFDIKKTFARFAFHRMIPPSEFKQIDTKKVAKRYFNFNSNKLDDLGKYFGVGHKIVHTGWDLWERYYQGDPKAIKEMHKYCGQDVLLLEKVEQVMLPFMKNHPDNNIYNNTRGHCPNCFSEKLQSRGFNLRKNNVKIQRYQCLDCGAWCNGETIKSNMIK